VAIFCGGSGFSATDEGPACLGGTLDHWKPDSYGYAYIANNMFNYPGGDWAKWQQYQNAKARNIALNTAVILICYSGGSEGCLMYAKDRIESGLKVKSVVLLDPTYTGKHNAAGDSLTYGGGDPNVPFDDWKDYMNYILQNDGNILVVDDRGDGGVEDANNHPDTFKSPDWSPGVYYYTYENIEHSSSRSFFATNATNLNTDVAAWAYQWAAHPFGH
jgi:hypothetical protein